MESYLSKAAAIIALICFLVVGSAVAAILGQDSVPAAGVAAMTAPTDSAEAVVPNRESKADRLIVAAIAPDPAPSEPSDTSPAEPLRQTLAPTASTEAEAPTEVPK